MNKFEKILKEQIIALGTEIDQISNVYEKAQIRVKLIDALARVASATPVIGNINSSVTMDDIKSDKFKEEVKEEIKEIEPVFEEVEETAVTSDLLDEFNETSIEIDEPIEEVMNAIETTEIDDVVEEENVIEDVVETVENTEEIVQNEEYEPIIVLNEQDEEVDITDAYVHLYNYATDLGEDLDAMCQLALQIVQYQCIDKYMVLSELPVLNEDGEEEGLLNDEYKMYLAYLMTVIPEAELNSYVSEYTDGYIEQLIGYINNSNIVGFTEFVNIKLEKLQTQGA